MTVEAGPLAVPKTTTSPALLPRRSKRGLSGSTGSGKFWLAVAPALLLYGVFTLYPMAQVIGFSFTDSRGFNQPVNFIGLENFAEVFNGDADLAKAVGNTLIYAFFKVVVQTVLAFLIAVLLHQRLLLGNVYRAIFFAPIVISPVAVVFTWSFMFDPGTGTINSTLRDVGLGFLAQDWLGNYDLALLSVIVVDLWGGIGFSVVIFLAGLGTISSEVLEAAKMDGAKGFKAMRFITVPLMAPSIGLVLVLAINGALRAFDTVYLMTKGGPGNQTELFMTTVFSEGLVKNNFGYASAMAVLVIIVLIGIAAVQNKLNNKLAEGGNG